MSLLNKKREKPENEDPNIQYTDDYPTGMNVKDAETGITFIGTSERFTKKQKTNNSGIIILEER